MRKYLLTLLLLVTLISGCVSQSTTPAAATAVPTENNLDPAPGETASPAAKRYGCPRVRSLRAAGSDNCHAGYAPFPGRLAGMAGGADRFAHAKEIYQHGLQMGNDPAAFSKVGDCQNVHDFFLGIYENPRNYRLGDQYAYLQETIDHFYPSFARESLAVKGGWNVASVLSPMFANKTVCEKGEGPLACELRVNKPSIVLISMETWWVKETADAYEGYLRQIVEYVIAAGRGTDPGHQS